MEGRARRCLERCSGQESAELPKLLQVYRPKCAEFLSAKCAHFSGRSSAAKIADTGHTGTHAPQSMHSTGSMKSWSVSLCPFSSFFGWMQSTGQASTHAESLVPMQGSAITYAI